MLIIGDMDRPKFSVNMKMLCQVSLSSGPSSILARYSFDFDSP